jgi:hypothetical protein
MRSTRLFAVAFVFCAASSFGQTQLITNSAARSAEANALNTATTEQLRGSSSVPDGSEASKAPADDPIKAQSASRKQLIQLLDAQRPRFIPRSDLQSDTTCFFIRSYLMVRDDPHSDSTHRDGSTTCVPSARFRVYTADERFESKPPRLSEP